MKKFFTLCAMVLLCATMLAQAPQKMSYQAVVRGSDNVLVANQNVSVRISILQGSASGATVYTETHLATTNVNGLLTVEVGGGNSSQDFAQIPWAQGPFYLKSEIDPTGGANYSIESVQQLLSVPYALYAGSAGNVPAFAVTPTDTGYVLVLTMPDGNTQSYLLHHGQQGPAGSDGVSPTVTTLTAGDSTVVTITDATGPHTFVVHNGQQGAQGEQGPAGTNGINGTNGQDGQDGADGFSPTVTTVSAGDSTTVTITDANGPHTFVLHNGQQGPAGPAGSNGTNGVDGTNGRGIQEIAGPVSAGNVDTYTIHYTDGTTSTFTVTNGLDGAAAAAGVGIQSITKTGTSGLEDTYTITYTNGTTSTYTVTNGAPGADGANGTNGTNGQDGQDGFSPTVTTLTAGDSTTVTITDANGPHTFVVRNGQQGPQGPIGPAGASGSNGTNGQDGVSPTVTTLTAGDSTTVTITDANGPHTFVLHNGQQGPQGPIGPAGTNGTDGTNGQDGRGIQSISGPVTNGLVDTYTIHYTDNTTSTFTVANGAAGAQGLQGEQGPQGPAGVSPTVTAAASGSNIVITVTDSAGTPTGTPPPALRRFSTNPLSPTSAVCSIGLTACRTSWALLLKTPLFAV